ncbi:transposase [Nostoc sp. CENA543]|uniref:helix-turn-helix domain-containing protein n=1 Tax=Nostoc sp. CENA543 TaxID=1869241 RepID=UPI000CA13B10|nr:helix-turn-helix domain-containing protein [Nostoc sp. CENA543]AUT00321.1 transposase [Nostoc sp. CENA543]
MEAEIKDVNLPNGQLLTPFQRKLLLKNLTEDLPGLYRQRIQIMLLADEGKSQTNICRTLGCCPATARHWIHIARSGMAHQWQTAPIGRPKAVNEEYLERLKTLVNDSPRNYGYAFQRWTANWLSKHLAKEFGFQLSDCHIKRLLKTMGLSTKSKPVITPETPSQISTNSQISIGNLSSESLLNESERLPIHFLKIKTNS